MEEMKNIYTTVAEIPKVKKPHGTARVICLWQLKTTVYHKETGKQWKDWFRPEQERYQLFALINTANERTRFTKIL
jgi:hypothetical protein